jgi:tetratricopeptide (TPR) repeat protein
MEAHMKKTSLILAILLLICSPALLAQEWSAAQKEVWSVEQKLCDALQKSDTETLLGFIHPDYRGLNHGTNVPIDKAGFQREGLNFWKNNKVTYCSIQPLSIQVFGNAAVVHYVILMMARSADAKETPVHAAWTDIMTREGDKWLLIADNGNELSEIPITTASAEARGAYLDALLRSDDGDVAKALSSIETALQKDPNLALAYQVRAVLGEPTEQAQRDLVSAMSLRNSVSQGERYWILCNDFLQKGSVGRAALYLDTLLQFFPRDKRVQSLAGNFYFGWMGDIPSAIPYMEAAVKIDPNYAGAYNQLGYWYSSVGRKDAAEQAFKQYIALKPEAANAHDSYAEFLRINGRYDESIAEYQKALLLDPSFNSPMRGIGDCCLKKGDIPKALEQYQRAAEKTSIAQDRYSAYSKRAMAFVIQGNIPDALSALDEMKELALKDNYNGNAINAEFYQAYMLSALGQASDGLKKVKECIKHIKSLQIADDLRDSWLSSADWLLAYNSLEAKDLKKAKDHIAAFQKDVDRRKNPNELNQLKGLQGYLDIQEARPDDAIAKFSSLPEDPGTLHALVVAYALKGDKEKAQAALDKLNKWQTLELNWAIESRQASLNRGI